MNRNRSIVTALLLGLATTGLVANGGSSTAANPAFVVSGHLAAPSQPARGHAWIQGVIRDNATHRALDDVRVEAYPADDPSADPVASSLTYASPDGSTDHGFYRLWGLKPGSYQVRFVSGARGYRSDSLTFTVTNRQIVDQDVMLQHAQAATSIRANLDDAQVAPDQRGRVHVTVASGATGRPAGDVEVRSGRQVVGTAALRAGDRGRVLVTLKRLDPGSYDLRAYFLGSTTLKASTSKAVALTVKKPRRHR